MFAVIRIKGSVNVAKEIKDTMKMMKLIKSNHCVLLPQTGTFKGMLQKSKDCVTWGEIDEKTLGVLIYKRGRLQGDKKVDEKQAREIAKKTLKENRIDVSSGLKKVFRLNPPSKGYKSIRRPYPKGSLGYRGSRINELLKRMM
jgi:large subunit ribosomal protein L30